MEHKSRSSWSTDGEAHTDESKMRICQKYFETLGIMIDGCSRMKVYSKASLPKNLVDSLKGHTHLLIYCCEGGQGLIQYAQTHLMKFLKLSSPPVSILPPRQNAKGALPRGCDACYKRPSIESSQPRP